MRLKQPVDLGEPDIKGDDRRGLSFWMDRKLDFLGIPGAIGSVVTLGPYGAVIPPQDVTLRWSDWLDAEVTLVAADGRYWHRLGVEGVYTQAVVHGDGLALSEGKLYRTLCDTFGLHCFSLRADLVKLLATEKIFALLALIAAMILASCAAILVIRSALSAQPQRGVYSLRLSADHGSSHRRDRRLRSSCQMARR
jgi:hypothetical protein